MKKYILTLLTVLICLSTSAQVMLTLDDYRERVKGYNQQLKASKESTIAMEAKRNVVRVGFLPQLDANAQYAFTNKVEFMDGVTLDQHNYTGSLDVVMPIYTGGGLNARYKAAKIEKEIAVFNEEYTLDQVVYNADLIYWNAAANKQFLENTQTYYNTVASLFDVIKTRFDDGMLSKTDILQVQTRLKEAEQQLIAATHGNEIAHQNLNIMMGEKVDLDYRTANSIKQIVALPMEKNLDEVLTARPDFSIAQRQVSLQEQNAKVAMSKFLPQLSVGATGQWGTRQINIDGSTTMLGNGFAALSFPLFHWGERKYTKSMTNAAIRMTKLEMELKRDNIRRELSAAWSRIAQYSGQLEVANENLLLAQENLDLNTFSYKEGKLPILDVLSAQMSWVQAFTSVINTNLGYKTAVAEYDRIVSSHALK